MVESCFPPGSYENPLSQEAHEDICAGDYWNWTNGKLSECDECRAVVITPFLQDWEDEAEAAIESRKSSR